MVDVRTLAAQQRRRAEAHRIVEALEARQGMRTVATKTAATAADMAAMADAAVDATIGFMWLGVHL